ncbi:MAG: AAA family ATPase [Bacteroidota bacterium]
MRIISLAYSDVDSGWELAKIHFNKLTLLVGASGVGKTQILTSLLRLRSLSRGERIRGIKWEIHFLVDNGDEYVWSGAFEQTGRNVQFTITGEDSERSIAKISWEKLVHNGQIIVDRQADHIAFKGVSTVKLPRDKSVFNLLKEEELLAPAYEGFQKIIFSDQVNSRKHSLNIQSNFLHQQQLLERYVDINAIRAADETLLTKLFLSFHNAPSIMEQIVERFTDVFPFVEAVRFAPLDLKNIGEVPAFVREMPFLQIKEVGVEHWILQPEISSGMYRSLLHLCELYLTANGTIVLIDEFENSLGVNCIDEITADIQIAAQRGLQFVITSHHPYIINQIHHKNWKLITRQGSVVTAKDAATIIDFQVSKQEAFIQLTQREEFTTGIAS